MSGNKYVWRNQSLPPRFLGGDRPCGDVEITIDWAKVVAHLGSKAAHNTSHKSGLAFGIKAKFIPRKAP